MMKRFPVLFLILALVACGGGSDGPVDPPDDDNNPPPFTVTGGSFDLTSTVSFNGCGQSTDWSGTYDVQIDGTSLTLGNWGGAWTPRTVTGTAQSTIQTSTSRNCTITEWTEAQIKFTTVDEFTGTFTFVRRVAGDCTTACRSTWLVTGTRVMEPPPVESHVR